MTRLYLVRHGTHDLVGKVLAGRMPGVSLSAEGVGQAKALAVRFGTTDLSSVLSSPVERCRETAAPIAACRGLPVLLDAALDELDCGAWTGQTFDALRRDPRWHAWNDERGSNAVPGGETIGAVEARAMAFVARLAATKTGPVLAVSHSDVIKVVVLSCLGASLALHGRLEVAPASITTLDLWPGGSKLVRLNEELAA